MEKLYFYHNVYGRSEISHDGNRSNKCDTTVFHQEAVCAISISVAYLAFKQYLHLVCPVCSFGQHYLKYILFHCFLQGLGRAILGNFSTDQIAIKLTKISKQRHKTIEEL